MIRMDVDLYTPEVIANPWPVLERIREAGPVVWNERGYWMSARDRICRQMFASPEKFTGKPIVPAFFGEEAFISIDDKTAHNKLRLIWNDAFRREAIQALARTVRTMIDDMLDPLVERLRDGDSVDMVAGLCQHLPGYVIAHLFGVPADMRASIVRWSDEMAASTATGFDAVDYESEIWQRGERARQDMAAYITDQIQYRRAHPGDDLISKMVHSELGRTLSDEVVLINLRLLLFGGSETSANWLAHITHTLATRPALRCELATDRSLVPAAVDEILRWEPVVHALPRSVARDDIEIEGVRLPEGDPVVILLGAANRDPRRHDRPDDLDIRREGPSALVFGFGLHNCIGMYLAKLEAVQTTNALLDRIPDFALAGDIHYGGFTVRGPAVAPIALS